MEKNEFAKIVMALRTYYPRENLLPNEQAVTLWYEQMQDLDYASASTALKKWVATNKWSPSIAELREHTMLMVKGEVKDWSEAWEDVRNAVRQYGWYNADDAVNSFDELTKKAVKQIGFTEICTSENQAAIRANFRDIYNILAERKKKERQLPDSIRKEIEKITNMYMIGTKDVKDNVPKTQEEHKEGFDG